MMTIWSSILLHDGIYVDLNGNLHHEHVLFERGHSTIHRCTPSWSLELDELPDELSEPEERPEWQTTTPLDTPENSRPPTPPPYRPQSLESYEELLEVTRDEWHER